LGLPSNTIACALELRCALFSSDGLSFDLAATIQGRDSVKSNFTTINQSTFVVWNAVAGQNLTGLRIRSDVGASDRVQNCAGVVLCLLSVFFS
jgi:hypothetical protein